MGAAAIPIGIFTGISTIGSIATQDSYASKAYDKAELAALLKKSSGRVSEMEAGIEANMTIMAGYLEMTEATMAAVQLAQEAALEEVDLATNTRLAKIQEAENRREATRRSIRMIANGVDLSGSALLVYQQEYREAEVKNEALENELRKEKFSIALKKGQADYLSKKASAVFSLRSSEASLQKLAGKASNLSSQWEAEGIMFEADLSSDLSNLNILKTITTGVATLYKASSLYPTTTSGGD